MGDESFTVTGGPTAEIEENDTAADETSSLPDIYAELIAFLINSNNELISRVNEIDSMLVEQDDRLDGNDRKLANHKSAIRSRKKEIKKVKMTQTFTTQKLDSRLD